MKHFENFDREQQLLKEKIIAERQLQLYQISKESNDEIIKYLFNVNAGGCVALLAYFGTRTDEYSGPNLTMGLTFFALGLILVGVYKVVIFRIFERIFFDYKGDVESYYGGKIGWGIFLSKDEKSSNVGYLPYVIGYLSFFSFLTGFALCVITFIP